MRMRMVPLAGAIVLTMGAGGCAVRPIPGEVVMRPPAVVIEPPVYHWHWAWWPHYDVEHRYVLAHRAVIVRDHHYYPFYEEANPYVRKDRGEHRGWFKHHRDHDHDDD